MDKATLICDCTIRADEDVVRERLAEDLDLEDVRDDFLRLAVNVRVHQRDVVVAGDHIPERREPLLDALEGNGVREGVAQVLQLLVRRRRGDEQPVAVARGETADDARAADGGVHDGDDVAELGLEGGVEVGAALDGDEAVGVGELGEDADVAVVFELEAWEVDVRECARIGLETWDVRVAMEGKMGGGRERRQRVELIKPALSARVKLTRT
jgi:hypothetical protein